MSHLMNQQYIVNPPPLMMNQHQFLMNQVMINNRPPPLPPQPPQPPPQSLLLSNFQQNGPKPLMSTPIMNLPKPLMSTNVNPFYSLQQHQQQPLSQSTTHSPMLLPIQQQINRIESPPIGCEIVHPIEDISMVFL
jgi:hypothetical protein